MRLPRNVIPIIGGCVLLLGLAYLKFLHPKTAIPLIDYCKCSTVSSAISRPQVQKLESPFIQTPMLKAQTQKKLGPTFLLIMIPILFSSIQSRDLIRDTWYKGFNDSEDVMLRYIMGVNGLDDLQINKLHEENKTHGDIVFLDNFTEGVWALTNKTIALMKWATENVDFTYLMKCDDDTFVYVKNAVMELKRRHTTKRLYYGIIESKLKPIHNNQSKWVDLNWNISDKYLPFARGGCYILSEDLVQLLVRQSHRLKRHPLEDVAMGLWLAPFVYERRNDNLMCFSHRRHGCRKDFRVAYLFLVKSDRKLKQTFYTLHKESLNMRANR